MRNKRSRSESRLSRCMKATMRLLSKARDMYIHGMTECSGRFTYVDAAMGCPTGPLSTLPRSFSVSSTRSSGDDDLKELIRAASVRSYGNLVDLDLVVKPTRVSRSRSVEIGRIHEDKPCDFGDDIYPRSRSYAVHTRTGVF